jgi:hypothetical protein
MRANAIAIIAVTVAISATSGATLASAQTTSRATTQASKTPTCHSYGAVGTSSATVSLPSHAQALRYFVTVTVDQVSNAPYPQNVNFQGALQADLSNTMNPASYNDGPLGGMIGFWDSLNHVPNKAPASTLTAQALNPGGQIRLSVLACPESLGG